MPQEQRFQDLTQFKMPSAFRGRPTWLIQIWWVVESTLFRCSPHAFFAWRNALLRLFGAKIGQGVRIRSTVRVTYPWKLIIGDHVWIGDDCVLYNLAEIVLGCHVALAHSVYLCTGMHEYNKRDFPIYALSIRVQDEVWLANDVFVGLGVTIGRGAVVGTRSTVLHDLPGGMICYGSPAKAIKPRLSSADL